MLWGWPEGAAEHAARPGPYVFRKGDSGPLHPKTVSFCLLRRQIPSPFKKTPVLLSARVFSYYSTIRRIQTPLSSKYLPIKTLNTSTPTQMPYSGRMGMAVNLLSR